MHYRLLATAEISEILEDREINETIHRTIEGLKDQHEKEPNILGEIYLQNLEGLRTSFARQIAYVVAGIMAPYEADTENPDYLEFEDRTPELRDEYENSRPDCIKLPQGKIVEADKYPFGGKYVIQDGKVFQREAGPLHHIKRTRKSKKLTALPSFPRAKLYKNLADYAENEWGYSYDEKQQGYGFYCNLNAMWDWYSIGGRWSALFLVKESCTEYSYGERSWCNSDKSYDVPEGYKWVCAARKKDIEWQVMRDWYTLKETEQFKKLERMFLLGKIEDDFQGYITEDGVKIYCGILYRKGESPTAYRERCGIPVEWRYPVKFSDIVNADGWFSKYDIHIPDNGKTWRNRLDEYIDSLSDDAVLIGVDYHM